jgi:Transposase DDE domain/Domain of unknown function (DUF4372)
MAHCSTVFSQVVRHLPRARFEKFVREGNGDRRVRTFSCWNLFLCHIFAQLSGVDSLRDLETTFRSRLRNLYHLGLDKFSRSTMADANEKRDSVIFEKMFNELVKMARSRAPGHTFRFKNPLYSLDSSTITLCLSMFRWAKFRTRKGALKIHTLLDHRGHLPSALVITDGKGADIKAAQRFHFEPDSILVVDRAYVDYCWLSQLCHQGVWWVTRLKKRMDFQVVERRPVDRSTGVTSDWTIRIRGAKADSIPMLLRRVRYVDRDTGKAYEFFTNIFHLSAKEIADIYKARWDIEQFFKWIKQNLKIKSFFGTSENAVRIQVWCALCVYLMVAYLKFLSRSPFSLSKLLVRIRANLMEKARLVMVLYQQQSRTNPAEVEEQLSLTFGV